MPKIIRHELKEIPLDGGFENHILAGIASFNKFAEVVIPVYKPVFMTGDQTRLIMDWFIEFYKDTGHVVGDNLSALIEVKQKIVEEDDLERLLLQLQQLIEQNLYGNVDVSYLITQTIDYFNRRLVDDYSAQLKYFYANNKDKEARSLIENFKLISVQNADVLDLSSKEDIKRIEPLFLEEETHLFELPDALGDLLNDDIVEGGFISILAPEKSGKSFFLLDMARRAARVNLHPLYIDAGDMNRKEVLMRFICRVKNKAIANREPAYEPVLDCVRNVNNTCSKGCRINNCAFSLPADHMSDADEDIRRKQQKRVSIEEILECNPDYQPCSQCYRDPDFQGSVYWKKWEGDVLYPEEVYSFYKRRYEAKRRTPYFVNEPAGTLTVNKIEQIMVGLKDTKGFLPKVVIIDYVDLLSATFKNGDFRLQTNSIWTSLRALALKYNCLIITASQADARSYNQFLLNQSNFSEDKRKNAHVTAIWGLNRMSFEKVQMITRVNQILSRRCAVDIYKTVTVLQNLACANPIIGSFYTPFKKIS